MSYNSTTDFLGLWRNNAGQVSKVEMPGLDYIVAALARAGLLVVSVSATAPVANQPTTAWLQTAVPSFSGEGVFQLWNQDTASYAPATPELFMDFLQASAGESGISWWTTTGPPINTLGQNGDLAIRLDLPNGIYGPKTAGAWPTTPISGTVAGLTSAEFDGLFGSTPGQLIYRGASAWQSLPVGGGNNTVLASPFGTLPVWESFYTLLDNLISSAQGSIMFRGSAIWQPLPPGSTANQLLVTGGAGANPAWENLSTLFDATFGGSAQGSILYRNASVWAQLAPGTAGQLLTTGGAGTNPAWANSPNQFPSGTVMLFQQSAAPTGWTKLVAVNDVGLRIVSGSVTAVGGVAFSTVFAQTAVGNTTLSVSQIPAHTHQVVASPGVNGTTYAPNTGANQGASPASSITSDGGTGGAGAHAHAVTLNLSYIDVIMASKT